MTGESFVSSKYDIFCYGILMHCIGILYLTNLQWDPVVMMPTLMSLVSKLRVVMMPTLSSLMAPEFVMTITSGATSEDTVGIMTTLCFHCIFYGPCMMSNSWSYDPLTNRWHTLFNPQVSYVGLACVCCLFSNFLYQMIRGASRWIFIMYSYKIHI